MPQNLERLLHADGLDRVARAIAAEARSCLRLATARVDESDLEIARSRFGGSPDLPPSTEWPRWKGAPLSFLAQINTGDFRDFAIADLPPATLVSFFYHAEQATWGFDPNDRGSWRVLATSLVGGPSLERRPSPPVLTTTGTFHSCSVAIRADISLPDPYSRVVRRLGLTDRERSAYGEVLDELGADEPSGVRHQILGHPEQIQDEMQLECQLVSNGIYCGNPAGYADPRRAKLEEGADDWRLLMQIDSDDAAGMTWGDAGRLYFWILAEALASRQFENVWMILQCY